MLVPNSLRNSGGFTFIELIMVMTLLGILSVTILADTGDVILNAERAAAQKVIGAVRSGLVGFTSQELIDSGEFDFPPELNPGLPANSGGYPLLCDSSHPCFGEVLRVPITDGTWEQNGVRNFTHLASVTMCRYFPADGAFECR